MVLAISFFFYPYLCLCLASPCPYHHDLCRGPACLVIAICVDGRGRDRDPCPDHDPGPCLCLGPADLCPFLDDRDLEIVNENANDVCFSYKKKSTSIKRSAQNEEDRVMPNSINL